MHDDLAAPASRRPPPPVDEARLEAALAKVRGGALQRRAGGRGRRGRSHRRTTILTGGPGTGKTTTVARLLALLADQAAADGRLAIALAAPTGKAATRLQEAVVSELADVARTWPEAPDLVGRLDGLTLHRLLGWRPDNATRFRHDREQPAQVRRGRRRRVLDGRADHDGPAAGGAAARVPAGAGRRPAPAHVGRRGRGAQRPGRRLRRSPGLPGLRAHRELPVRGGHQVPRRRAARGRRRRGAPRAARPVRPGVLRRGRRRGRDRGGAAARLGRRRAARSGRPRPTRTRPARWPSSTATACCAPTARGPTAYAAGTSWSSAGSPRTPSRSDGLWAGSGTSAARCW